MGDRRHELHPPDLQPTIYGEYSNRDAGMHPSRQGPQSSTAFSLFPSVTVSLVLLTPCLDSTLGLCQIGFGGDRGHLINLPAFPLLIVRFVIVQGRSPSQMA